MNSSALLKNVALASVASLMVACSSNPKVPEAAPAPEPVLAAATADIVDTPRGPSLTLDDVLFDFEQASLRPEAGQTIQKAAAYLRANPQRNALVEGHTDHTGDAAYNQTLSEKRSGAIKDALVARGISSARIKSVGMGENQPLADNQTLTGRKANRRAEIIFEFAGAQ